LGAGQALAMAVKNAAERFNKELDHAVVLQRIPDMEANGPLPTLSLAPVSGKSSPLPVAVFSTPVINATAYLPSGLATGLPTFAPVPAPATPVVRWRLLLLLLLPVVFFS
jgi:hypothetical protein